MDGSNSGWEKRDEYVGVEVEFNSLLSGKKIKRVMIPNVGDFGNLTVKRRDYGNEPTTLRLSKYRTVVVDRPLRCRGTSFPFYLQRCRRCPADK